MSEEKNLTLREENGTDLATPQIFGGGSAGLQFWTSIPAGNDKRAYAAEVSQLMGPADMPLKKMRDQVIEVINLLAHNVTVLTERDTPNGKEEIPVDATRIVFSLADGTTLDSVSAGVVSSLRNIFALAGMPPYNPPLKLSLKESDTRKGRRVYTLSIVG